MPREPEIRLLSRDDLDDLDRTPRERYIAAVIRQGFRELDPDAPPEVVARVISDTIDASRQES